MIKIIIEKAKNADASELTELTLRSKSYWNYTPKQIEQRKNELTVTSGDADKKEIYKLVVDTILIGYYSYSELKQNTTKLHNMFVEPQFIRQGYGKVLIADFLQWMKREMYSKVTLDADPNAEAFYKKMGFKTVGKLDSTIEGRFLPIMEMDLTNWQDEDL